MAPVVILTFVLTATIVFGVYWLSIGREEAREARALSGRLTRGLLRVAPESLLAEEMPWSTIPWLDRALGRVTGSLRPVRSMIERSALGITPGALLLTCVFAALAAYTGVRFLAPAVLPLAWIAAPVAGVLPFLFVWRRAGLRLRKFEEGFPVAIDLITRALRAGHSLPTAMELVGQEVSDPIGAEFRLLFERQNYGMSLEQALHGFAERIPLIDARFFVTAVLTQREVGGNLAEVLENLSRVIRDRFTVRREIRVASAHGRITGWVLGLLAPIVGIALFIINPDQMRPLVDDPVGVRILLTAIVAELVGVFFIKRLLNVEY